MRRFAVLSAAGVAAVLMASAASAQTWCSTTFPNAVFCDDFDSYADGSEFDEEWLLGGPCASWLTLDDGFVSSPPNSAKMNVQENGSLGYSINPIVDAVRDHFGSSCTSGAAMGTDLNPLVLEGVINGQSPTNRAPYDNSFLTLTSGSAHAPTDWAWSEFCGCSSPDPRYPIICQQESPGANCPPIGAAPPASAIAVGFLAYLDSDPCECSGSWHSPRNEHLSFFDGTKWYKLRSGLFPGSGDFQVRAGENKIKVTIKTSSIKVELTCPSTGEYSWCQLPGGFAGPFNTVATGFHISCLLKADEWVCRGDPTCDDARGVPEGGVPRYDNIVLHGGICYASPGACCYPDTHCDDGVLGGDCVTLGGQPAAPGTTCETTACCPPLLADHDMDEDVDMEDFGWFQSCLSGADMSPPTIPCRCANSNQDEDDDVDAEDLAAFLGCLAGPGVPIPGACGL